MRRGSRVWLAAALLAVIAGICGCSDQVATPQPSSPAYLSVRQGDVSTASSAEAPASASETITLSPPPPGVAVGAFTYDYPGKLPVDVRTRLRAELSMDWDRSLTGPGQPRTFNGLMRVARFQFAPLYSIDASASVKDDVFAVSHRLPNSYICILRVRGAMITAFAWGKGGPWGSGWGSFDGAFFNRFPQAEKVLRSHFGPRTVRVRYVTAMMGCWVVGRAGDEEKAVFVAGQGEPPFQDGQLYGTHDVIVGALAGE